MYVKNIVLFDYCNYDKVKSIRMATFNPYIIELSNNVPFNLKNDLIRDIKNRNRIIYFGRINNEQKNINLLNQINHYLKLIDFYGNGNENLIKELGESYKGYIDSGNKLKDLFAKYKYMILMSNYEGFPYSLVQSLCYGLPIIVLNTFLSANFLVNDNKNGFLLKPNQSVAQYVTQIKDFYNIENEKYMQLSLNAYKFAQENLSNKQFEEK
ncbi:glycosyltransferase [bacterium]|nr:glycosyltransferase [bacterium]